MVAWFNEQDMEIVVKPLELASGLQEVNISTSITILHPDDPEQLKI